MSPTRSHLDPCPDIANDHYPHPDSHPGADGAPPPIDYRPVLDAARTAVRWVLDVARAHAPESDDREAIDRVERAALATLDGVPMCCRPDALRASHEDALVTAGILIERFEIDFRIPGLSQIFGAFYDGFDWWQRSNPAAQPDGGDAERRHHDAASLAKAIAAQLARPPRVAHGPASDRALDRPAIAG